MPLYVTTDGVAWLRYRRPDPINLMKEDGMEGQQSKNIIVKCDLDTVYQHWADFERFPQFMRHIKSVSKTGDKTSHWVMDGPLGKTLEWDAETTLMDKNKRIAWNSTEGDLKTSGQVTFTDLG